MPAQSLDTRVAILEQEVSDLRELVQALTARLEGLQLSEPSTAASAANSASSLGVRGSAVALRTSTGAADPATLGDTAARNRVLRGIGHWLRDRVRGTIRGTSGR